MSFASETLVLVVVAVACALPGAFLVLRRMALVSDAVGHVLLFGIVLAYFATRDLNSPWLLAGAAATGHALRAAGRSPSPYWNRFLDIAEFTLVAGLLPVALAVAGGYGRARNLGG
jgi:hypothetical protein